MKTNKEYFEGWYLKNTNEQETISFIPGICSNLEKKEAFIQIITKGDSWYVPYKITEFQYNDKPFEIKIGNNFFSNNEIEINIHNEQVDIEGKLKYENKTPIQTSVSSPNIMGIFSFVPKMECKHAVISMKHSITGDIKINNKIINFDKGIGYIEKDWGTSFPTKYIWGQANCFRNKNASFIFAIATIPFQGFHFEGLIGNLIIEGKEYRFATYNGSKIIKNDINGENVNIILQKSHLTVEIIAKSNQSKPLKAPKQGKMKNHIQESIQAEIEVILKYKDKLIYQDKSYCAGLEVIK